MNTNIQPDNDPRDQELWAIARKRASFRRHLFTYIAVNSLLWIFWALRGGSDYNGIPWPLWSTLGWGLGLAINYADAYMFHRENSVEQEYEKLKKKQQQQ